MVFTSTRDFALVGGALLVGYGLSQFGYDLAYMVRMYWIEHVTTSATTPPPADVDVEGVLFPGVVTYGDIDRNKHMNNARYIRALNFSRRHFFVTIGLWKPLRRQGLNLIVSAQTVRYRRELRLFDRYCIRTRIRAWSEARRCFYVESRFEGVGDGFVHAVHVCQYTLVGGGGSRLPALATLLQDVPLSQEGRAKVGSAGDTTLPPTIQHWNDANDASSRELNPAKAYK